MLIMNAWNAGYDMVELDGYRNLALQYFYQGYMKDADTYNERAQRGFLEANHSKPKISAI